MDECIVNRQPPRRTAVLQRAGQAWLTLQPSSASQQSITRSLREPSVTSTEVRTQ